MKTPHEQIARTSIVRPLGLHCPAAVVVRILCARMPIVFLVCFLTGASVCLANPLSGVQARAREGDANAKGVVSVLLQTDEIPVGDGESKAQKALKLAEESADADSSFGLYALGRIHGEGVGMKKDADKAKQLYSRALPGLHKLSEGGDPNAQWLLGVCYHVGRGVEKDQDKAVEWTRKSAEQGNSSAQKNLGYCYWDGEGVEKNPAEAAKWYLKSAEQGNKQAMRNLAVMDGSELKAREKNLWLYRAAEFDEEFYGGPETRDVMVLTVGGQLRNPNQPPRSVYELLLEGARNVFKIKRLREIRRSEPRESEGRKLYPVRLVFEGPDGGEERWDLIFFKDEFGQWAAEPAKNDVPS